MTTIQLHPELAFFKGSNFIEVSHGNPARSINQQAYILQSFPTNLILISIVTHIITVGRNSSPPSLIKWRCMNCLCWIKTTPFHTTLFHPTLMKVWVVWEEGGSWFKRHSHLSPKDVVNTEKLLVLNLHLQKQKNSMKSELSVPSVVPSSNPVIFFTILLQLFPIHNI